MRALLKFTAIAEIATGLALVAVPVLVVQLLLGSEISGAAVQIARIAGFALVGLGISCWPGPPRIGMATYSGLVTLYLGWLGITGAATGGLRWPVVALHTILTILLMIPRGKTKDVKGA